MNPAEEMHVSAPSLVAPTPDRRPINLHQALQELCDAAAAAKDAWGSDRLTRAAEAVVEGAFIHLLVPRKLVPTPRASLPRQYGREQ